MPTDFATIQQIASSSLMPDFFAVRIDEEGLFDGLKEMIAKIKLAQPLPVFDHIKQISAASAKPMSSFDGTQPRFGQVPPSWSRSSTCRNRGCGC